MARHVDDRFNDFVADHSNALLRIAYLVTSDHGHAEDVVQIALLKVMGRWHKLGEPDDVLAFARRVVVNTATSRARKRSNSELVALPPHRDSSTDDRTNELADRDLLSVALRGLPPGMRAVLVLRYFEDLSEADTAAALNCSLSNVRAQAARGLTRLREHFTALAPTGRS